MDRQFNIGRRTFLASLGPGVCHLAFGPRGQMSWEAPSLVVAHCADPQFGFCRVDSHDAPAEGAYAEDLARMERMIAQINALHVDVVACCGDMVHVAADLSKDWPRLLNEFNAPILVAPGNHDVGCPVAASKLSAFNEVFGTDHRTLTVKGWKFLVTNSQQAFAPADDAGRQAHDAWLEQELQAGKSAGMPMIVVNHIPPFVNSVDESDTSNNLPSSGRKAYLDRLVDAGVKFHLSGHIHRTLKRKYGSLPILNPEIPTRNFDGGPKGFRLLKIYTPTVYTWDFVPLET